MRGAIATVHGLPPEFTDDLRLVEALADRGVTAARIPWEQPGVDWSFHDAVVILN